MQVEKKPFNEIMNKMVVTKEGKRLGFVRDVTFETRSGEIINIVLKDATPYTKNLAGIEKSDTNNFLVPYSALIAVGDYVIISEEDLL